MQKLLPTIKEVVFELFLIIWFCQVCSLKTDFSYINNKKIRWIQPKKIISCYFWTSFLKRRSDVLMVFYIGNWTFRTSVLGVSTFGSAVPCLSAKNNSGRRKINFHISVRFFGRFRIHLIIWGDVVFLCFDFGVKSVLPFSVYHSILICRQIGQITSWKA